MSIFFQPGEPATHEKMNKMSIRKGTLAEVNADPDINVIWYITDYHTHAEKRSDGLYVIDNNAPGAIEIFAGTSTMIPNGWLLCDGRAIDREDYKGLFDTIGTTYGNGDGTSTFNIPDMVDEGKFAYQGDGQYIGVNSVTLTASELPTHSHSIGVPSVNTANRPICITSPNPYTSYNPYSQRSTTSAGGSQPHENRPPFIRMRYIIKV